MIAAVPRVYCGVTYRSSIEADWAATFDVLGIAHRYESVRVLFPTGEVYWPDFYLPALRTYAEVKGPHSERLAKTTRLATVLDRDWAEGVHAAYRVVVLRPYQPDTRHAEWTGTRASQQWRLRRCPTCAEWDFVDLGGDWRCGACEEHSKPLRVRDLLAPASDPYGGDHLTMTRAAET